MYTLLYQHADSNLGEYYLEGEVSTGQVQTKFEQFPWQEQLSHYQTHETNAPTFWLKSPKKGTELIISLVAENQYYVSLCELEVRKTLGLFPVKNKTDHGAFGFSEVDAQALLSLYLDSHIAPLKKRIERQSQTVLV